MNNLVFLNNHFIKKPFYIYIHDIKRGIVSKSLLQYNVYEGDSTLIVNQLLNTYCDTNTIFIDIGANIGYYSLMAAKHNIKKVYAFEPIQTNINLLKKSIQKNNFSNIELIEKCVGKYNKLEYMTEPTNLGGCSVTNQQTINHVECIKLDDFQFEDNILLCKIDVEGFEKNVIDGGIELIKSQRVKYFIIELTPKKLTKSDDTVELSNILIENGYKMYRISHNLNYTLKNGLITNVRDCLKNIICRNFLFIL